LHWEGSLRLISLAFLQKAAEEAAKPQMSENALKDLLSCRALICGLGLLEAGSPNSSTAWKDTGRFAAEHPVDYLANLETLAKHDQSRLFLTNTITLLGGHHSSIAYSTLLL